jgi:aconitate hydratase
VTINEEMLLAPAPEGEEVELVKGENYGQGSSREHAALAPRYLGVRVVLAKSIARIHWQNLGNFGILPLVFAKPGDYDEIEQGDVLTLAKLHETVQGGTELEVIDETKERVYLARHSLSPRQVDVILAGSLIGLMRERLRRERSPGPG